MKDVALRAGILGVLMQNFFVGSLDTAVGPVWSLAGEVVFFYLVLPLLGLLALTAASHTSSRIVILNCGR